MLLCIFLVRIHFDYFWPYTGCPNKFGMAQTAGVAEVVISASKSGTQGGYTMVIHCGINLGYTLRYPLGTQSNTTMIQLHLLCQSIMAISIIFYLS